MASSETLFLRLSPTLKAKIGSWAKRNGWDLSKQVRATLEKIYGEEPIIPDPINKWDDAFKPDEYRRASRKPRNH